MALTRLTSSAMRGLKKRRQVAGEMSMPVLRADVVAGPDHVDAHR